MNAPFSKGGIRQNTQLFQHIENFIKAKTCTPLITLSIIKSGAWFNWIKKYFKHYVRAWNYLKVVREVEELVFSEIIQKKLIVSRQKNDLMDFRRLESQLHISKQWLHDCCWQRMHMGQNFHKSNPYKHTTFIQLWNDVETTFSTLFQYGMHVVC